MLRQKKNKGKQTDQYHNNNRDNQYQYWFWYESRYIVVVSNIYNKYWCSNHHQSSFTVLPFRYITVTVLHRVVCTHISEKIWEEQILSQISKVLNRSVSDSIYSTPSITFATRSLSTEVLYIAWNSLMLLGTLGQKLHSWLIFQGWHCYCWAAWDRSSSVILNFPSYIQQQLFYWTLENPK